MSDILKQIQALQEQFSNLFEVEGLGNPAVDVPPSQNKIKKDVKTKDGKAELVSVEDELFPYDGNKREQYRQKILDTINGMIQGTSTLEDLLQIVRQKKAPLKEAMELLECLIDEKLSPLQKRDMVQAIKFLKNTDKWKDNKDNLVDFLRDDAKNTVEYGFKHRHDKDVDLKKRPPAHFEEKAEQKKAPLKEAVELMEDLFSTILKQPAEKQGALVYKYHQAKNKENAGKDTYTQAKEEEKRKSREEKGQEKTEQRKKYRGKSTEDWKQGRLMDQIAKNATKLAKVSDPATAKAIRRNAQKADLKEALEIMEAIINEVSDKTAQSALDAAQQRYNRKGYEASMKLFRGDSKGAIEDGNKAQDEYNKHLGLQLKRAKRLGKKLVQDKNDHDSFKIEEALSLMEAIINEVSMDKWKEAAASSLPKRQEKALKSEEEGKQIWKDYEEASKKSPEDEPSLYRKAEKDAEAHAEEHKKNVDRASQAELVSMLKTKGKSANKTIKAAKKVQDERSEDFYKNPNAKTLSRKIKASSVATADPVKSRNEADQ